MKLCSAALLALLLAASVSAGPVYISDTTVLGTDVTSGPSWITGVDILPTDYLNLTVSGLVYLQSEEKYGTNAAGVVAVAGKGQGQGVGTVWDFGGYSLGALLLGYDATWVQLFPADAGNGLGSLTPPSTLVLNDVLMSSLGFASTIPAGTTLGFRVWDTVSGDNSGSFSVTGIPEPSTAGLLVAAALAFLLARRYKR